VVEEEPPVVCPECHGLGTKGWPDIDELELSWDLSFKDKKSSDFVAGQVWGRKNAKYYLFAQTHDRLSFSKTVQAFKEQAAAWPRAFSKLVEDAANGPAVIDTLREQISGIIAVKPEGGKVSRANAVSPMVEAGNVYLPDPSFAPWVDQFVEECAVFPNGTHDDQVDAMSQALNRMRAAEVGVTNVKVWE
jgi:predicted phage terminase large subunit-like protein